LTDTAAVDKFPFRPPRRSESRNGWLTLMVNGF